MTPSKPFSILFAVLSVILSAGCSEQGDNTGAEGTGTQKAGAAMETGQQALNPRFAPALQATGAITAAELEADIRELSSDAYQGRGPGTPGDEMTQAYLVRQLQMAGIQPGAVDGWLQWFTLLGLSAQQPDTWSFHRGDKTRSYQQGSDFILGSGIQAELATLDDAELVFVGYGIQAPEYNWDDYKGVDVSGKVLLMLNNDPHQSPDLFAGEARLYYGRWTYKYEIAAKLGAAGVIIVHTDYSAGYPWQVVQTSWSGPQFELPSEGEQTLQVKAWMTETASTDLLYFAGHDLGKLTQAAQQADFQPIELDLRTSIELPVTIESTRTANVLGLLPGRDPTLKEQAVIYTAHHDHLGIDPDAVDGEDAIYNGARDNASGVASVLAIARAFRKLDPPPRRSVLFALVGAEEQGLLGSKYYERHPTFAPGNLAANINMDGAQIAGRSRNIAYIGYGRSSIDAVADEVAHLQSRYVVGDESPSLGMFYRSDHFSLAAIGVPSLNYKGGSDMVDGGLERGREISRVYIGERYHQPNDEVSDIWRFDGLAEDAEFGFLAGYLLAEQDNLPTWREGDEFAAARAQALREVHNPPENAR